MAYIDTLPPWTKVLELPPTDTSSDGIDQKTFLLVSFQVFVFKVLGGIGSNHLVNESFGSKCFAFVIELQKKWRLVVASRWENGRGVKNVNTWPWIDVSITFSRSTLFFPGVVTCFSLSLSLLYSMMFYSIISSFLFLFWSSSAKKMTASLFWGVTFDWSFKSNPHTASKR